AGERGRPARRRRKSGPHLPGRRRFDLRGADPGTEAARHADPPAQDRERDALLVSWRSEAGGRYAALAGRHAAACRHREPGFGRPEGPSRCQERRQRPLETRRSDAARLPPGDRASGQRRAGPRNSDEVKPSPPAPLPRCGRGERGWEDSTLTPGPSPTLWERGDNSSLRSLLRPGEYALVRVWLPSP